MPEVPVGERRVSRAPLPGVRRTAAETATSMGAGLAVARANVAGAVSDIGGTVAAVGQQFARLHQQEVDRADSVAILNAENRIATWENQRLYSENGALNVKGKESFGLPEQIADEYTKLTGEIEAELGTQRQRDMFARVKLSRGAGLDLQIRRHVSGEMTRYEANELEGLLTNARSAAGANALDPARVNLELERGVGAIKTHAPRLGLGPEAVAKQVENFTTATHSDVISRLLSNDMDKAAKIYFEETKGQISGPALANIEKAIDEGTLRGESQRTADKIILAGGTLTEQREKVRAIEDPKLRDQVQQRVEHEASVAERIERENHEAASRRVYDAIESNPSLSAVQRMPEWQGMTGPERSGAMSYLERRAKGVPVETDLETYYNLYKQASDDPTKFSTENLLKYRGKLDDVEFKELTRLQVSIRGGNAKAADKDLAGYRTKSELLDDSLREYGYVVDGKDQTADEKQTIARLRRMLDIRVESMQALTGKQPSNKDLQDQIDALLSEKVTVTIPGKWSAIWPGGESFTDTTGTKPLIQMTPADVPEHYRKQIISALEKDKRPVSDVTILNLYLEARSRGLVK